MAHPAINFYFLLIPWLSYLSKFEGVVKLTTFWIPNILMLTFSASLIPYPLGHGITGFKVVDKKAIWKVYKEVMKNLKYDIWIW